MEDEEYDTCPDHGRQEVVGSDVTGGPDPYGIAVLACRCGVTSFGPGDPNHVVRTYPTTSAIPMPRFGMDLENGPSTRDWMHP